MITMQLANETYRLQLAYGADAPVAPSRLIAARGDSVAFQLVLCADVAYSVNTALGDFYAVNGPCRGRANRPERHERLRVAVKAPFAVTLQNEDFLTDDDGIKKADLLMATPVRESAPSTPSAVWVELHIPNDAAAGDYEVEVTLFAARNSEDERVVASATLPLRVMAYTLPAPTEWRFYLDLWQHNSNIARKHDVKLWSDAHFAVMEKYVQSLAALGQKAITVCVSEIPWAGQSSYNAQVFGGDLFEYSMVPITRRPDGTFTYDFSIMQRYIDLCRAAGLSGDVEVFGIANIWLPLENFAPPLCEEHPEPIRLRYLDEADGCMKYVRDAATIRAYIKALERYFIETEQIDRVRIAADEPADVERYRKSLSLLAEIAPAFRYKTAINHAEFIEEFGDRIDDFVPFLGCATERYDALMHYREKYPEKRFLWYICTGYGRPNLFLRCPLTEARMIGHTTDMLKLDGFLRWSYTVWPEDPRRELRFGHFECGDTNLVYPAYNGDVLLSLRYKNLQRGIADFELIRAAREKCGDGRVDAIVSRVRRVTDPATYYERMKNRLGGLHSNDFEEFNTVKAELLALLAE